MSALRTYLSSKISPQNAERLKIVSDSYKALRRTFKPRQKFPIPLAALKETLIAMGVKRGDHLLVHSSLTKLSTFPKPQDKETGELNPFQYATRLIELLMELVGDEGSLWMPTDSGIGYDNAMRGLVFDHTRSPSGNGLVTELFRRRRDVMRSTYPFQNLTGWGGLAKELIDHQERHPTPHPMDRSSPWYQLGEHGAKGLFLGTGFETNSSIHVVEYVHHAEYPTGIYFDKPFNMKFKDRTQSTRELPIYIHPFFRKPGAVSRFCTHLDSKYSLYSQRSINKSPIMLFSLKAQYEAAYREMQEGVTLYDPRFW